MANTWQMTNDDVIPRLHMETSWFAIFHYTQKQLLALQWRHNARHGVLIHQPHDCSLNLLFKA